MLPTYKNIKELEKDDSKTLIIIEKLNKFYNNESKSKYKLISIYHIYNPSNQKPIMLDLKEYTNLEILYLHNVSNVSILNLPNTLTGIAIKSSYNDITIVPTRYVKYVFRLSNMGDDFIDMSKVFHEDDIFDYNESLLKKEGLLVNAIY